MKKYILLLLVLSCSTASSTGKILTGFIQSAETDQNDNATEIYLFDGIDNYEITENDKQKELLDLVDKKVDLKGKIGSYFSGKKYVEVEDYQVLD